MGIIYAIYENDIPVYVGQTRQTIGQRWNEHLYAARHPDKKKNRSLVDKKIEQLGEKIFNIKILEDNVNINYLEERETFWQEKLNTLSPHGYNQHKGKQKTMEKAYQKISQKVVRLNPNTKEIVLPIYSSIREAARENHIGRATIMDSLKNPIKKSSNGFLWRYYKEG